MGNMPSTNDVYQPRHTIVISSKCQEFGKMILQGEQGWLMNNATVFVHEIAHPTDRKQPWKDDRSQVMQDAGKVFHTPNITRTARCDTDEH